MKKIASLTLCICIIVTLLAGCADVSTSMRVNEAFAGERVMEIDVPLKYIEQIDGGYGTLSRTINSNLPSSLTYTDNSNDPGAIDPAVFVFRLAFSSLDDYKNKVRDLIGRDPSVQFEYSNKLFSNHVVLRETSPRPTCCRGSAARCPAWSAPPTPTRSSGPSAASGSTWPAWSTIAPAAA